MLQRLRSFMGIAVTVVTPTHDIPCRPMTGVAQCSNESWATSLRRLAILEPCSHGIWVDVLSHAKPGFVPLTWFQAFPRPPKKGVCWAKMMFVCFFFFAPQWPISQGEGLSASLDGSCSFCYGWCSIWWRVYLTAAWSQPKLPLFKGTMSLSLLTWQQWIKLPLVPI